MFDLKGSYDVATDASSTCKYPTSLITVARLLSLTFWTAKYKTPSFPVVAMRALLAEPVILTLFSLPSIMVITLKFTDNLSDVSRLIEYVLLGFRAINQLES